MTPTRIRESIAGLIETLATLRAAFIHPVAPLGIWPSVGDLRAKLAPRPARRSF